MSFASLSALDLRAGYRSRAFSPVEVVAELGRRIELVDPGLNTFVTLTLDSAAEGAAAAEREYARGGGDRPLLGIPFAVKDVFDTAGVRTTYGSSMFAEHIPHTDAEAVALARRAGAILVGKTATHEFAWGITCANPHFGPTRNPWNADRIPGGSSGGSAAALAAGLVPLALGSDTAGSIRIPAGFCGVVGMKPTYGLLGTTGLFPLAPSFDHAGVMARTPADARLLLDALAPLRREPIEQPRVAICPDLNAVPLSPEVQAAFDKTRASLEQLGLEVLELRLPEAARTYDVFSTIQLVEAGREHRVRGLYPARRDEYGPDVRGRLELSESVAPEAYDAALGEGRRIVASFDRLFERTDLLLTAVASITAPPIGCEVVDHFGSSRSLRELVLPYTTPQTLAGLPSCAVRAGFDAAGLPIGVQITGSPHAEGLVLYAASRLFEATGEIQAQEPELAGRGLAQV